MNAGALVLDADESDLDGVRRLLRDYASSLPFELDFQDFDRELAALPGAYAPPRGALLVARLAGEVVGCVALRALGDAECELKRLFVAAPARGTGLGRRLAEAALDRAERLGYRRVLLDTTPGMEAAQALYRELGFRETEPYTHNPVPGARFLKLELASRA